MSDKTYLGDAVYGEFDQFGALVLTTEDGISVTNKIVLEPEVIQNLQNYFDYMKRKRQMT
jgi:hypothetical protein